MSRDQVITLLTEVKGEVGEIKGTLGSVQVQQELVRVALERQGQAIADLPCREHRKRISDLFKSVGVVRETTGQIRIGEVRRMARRKLLRRIGVIAVGVATVIGGIATALALWR